MPKSINIPLLDLKKEHTFLKKEIDKQIKECLSSQHWILGEKVSEFEKELSGYLDVKYAIGVNSGTDALLLSLRALAIKLKNKEYFDKHDEIITTPFTFAATAETILRSGATPVFADIDESTFNIDPQCIKKAINKNTVGILPVHLFGQACDMGEIVKIAKDNKLFILEDVAQAFGAGYRLQGAGDRKLGTIGDCGAFSFFPSKNLGSYGDAGAVVTGDRKTAELIVALRNHGQVGQYNAKYIGYNSRLDSIQAAVLLAKLKYIDKFNNLRIKIAKEYHNNLKSIKALKLPSCGSSHIYNLYTITVSRTIRDKMLKFLNNAGIAARIYYPLALHSMKAFKSARISGRLINAEKAVKGVFSLPINPFLKNKEIDFIIENIKAFSEK